MGWAPLNLSLAQSIFFFERTPCPMMLYKSNSNAYAVKNFDLNKLLLQPHHEGQQERWIFSLWNEPISDGTGQVAMVRFDRFSPKLNGIESD
jgi:hypothetical protein